MINIEFRSCEKKFLQFYYQILVVSNVNIVLIFIVIFVHSIIFVHVRHVMNPIVYIVLQIQVNINVFMKKLNKNMEYCKLLLMYQFDQSIIVRVYC